MSTFWLHACPRCEGVLYEIPDPEGAYVGCLQCGHVIAIVDEAIPRATGTLAASQPSAETGAA